MSVGIGLIVKYIFIAAVAFIFIASCTPNSVVPLRAVDFEGSVNRHWLGRGVLVEGELRQDQGEMNLIVGQHNLDILQLELWSDSFYNCVSGYDGANVKLLSVLENEGAISNVVALFSAEIGLANDALCRDEARLDNYLERWSL